MSTHARVKHLRYEVQMLGETMTKLEVPEFVDQTTINALIESFCIHARNLNEFFLEKRDRLISKTTKRTPAALRQKALLLGLPLGHRR